MKITLLTYGSRGDDFYKTDPDDFVNIKSEVTMIGGKTVYRAD
jgi:predicted amidohydrolase YtcJ